MENSQILPINGTQVPDQIGKSPQQSPQISLQPEQKPHNKSIFFLSIVILVTILISIGLYFVFGLKKVHVLDADPTTDLIEVDINPQYRDESFQDFKTPKLLSSEPSEFVDPSETSNSFDPYPYPVIESNEPTLSYYDMMSFHKSLLNDPFPAQFDEIKSSIITLDVNKVGNTDPRPISLSPDKKKIAYRTQDVMLSTHTLHIWDMSKNKAIATYEFSSYPEVGIDWSPNSKYVALNLGGDILYIIDFDSGKTIFNDSGVLASYWINNDALVLFRNKYMENGVYRSNIVKYNLSTLKETIIQSGDGLNSPFPFSYKSGKLSCYGTNHCIRYINEKYKSPNINSCNRCNRAVADIEFTGWQLNLDTMQKTQISQVWTDVEIEKKDKLIIKEILNKSILPENEKVIDSEITAISRNKDYPNWVAFVLYRKSGGSNYMYIMNIDNPINTFTLLNFNQIAWLNE